MTDRESHPTLGPAQQVRGWLRPVAGPVRRLVRSLYECHELALLCAPVRPVEEAHPVRVVERTGQPDAVLAAYATLRRPIAAERVGQRSAQGLRFFELLRADRLVATTWIVWKGTRFIDEVGYHVRLPPRSLWIRDVFVNPEARGQRLFGAFLDALVSGPFTDCAMLWSDVEPDNAPSMAAHVQYGFREASRVRSRHIGRMLLVRQCAGRGFDNLAGFKPGRKIVFSGPAFGRYCREHLA